jgi:hypothetical protein
VRLICLRFAAVVCLTNRRCGGCHWGREKQKRNETKQNTQTHPHAIQREGKKEKAAQAGMTAY